MRTYETVFVKLTYAKGYVFFDPEKYTVNDKGVLVMPEGEPVIFGKQTLLISQVIRHLAAQGYLYYGIATSDDRDHATVEPYRLHVFCRLIEANA